MYDIEETDYTYWEQQEHITLPNYSNYIIYPKQGLIWSKKTNKWIGAKNNKGYWQCHLISDDNKQWNTKIHRIIWQSINGEIPKGYEVNHIDEDKSNNSITNLNLLSPKENTNFGTGIQRRAIKQRETQKHKPIAGYNTIGELIYLFPSTREAQRNGFNSGAISNCCNGLRQSHKGYKWQYI